MTAAEANGLSQNANGHQTCAKTMDKLILGVDLDGVCSDFYGRIREIAAEWLERPLEELTTEVTYGLREWGLKEEEQYESDLPGDFRTS